MRARHGLVALLVCGCGGEGGRAAPAARSWGQDAAPPPADARLAATPADAAPAVAIRPLAGPYRSAKAAVAAWAPPPTGFAVVTLATTRVGAAELSLVRIDPADPRAASSCAVAVRFDRAFYLGPGFLCRAQRSDLRIAVVATAGAAPDELWFTVSYQRDAAPTVAAVYAIRCDLTGPAPACTEPPVIGGASFDCASVGPPGYCP